MTELDPTQLATLALDPDRAERIRRRGQRRLETPAAGPWIRAEAGMVALFSVLTLLWAASTVVHLG